MRASDEPLLLGNATKVWRLLNWWPTHDLRRTVLRILQYWRARLPQRPKATKRAETTTVRGPKAGAKRRGDSAVLSAARSARRTDRVAAGASELKSELE